MIRTFLGAAAVAAMLAAPAHALTRIDFTGAVVNGVFADTVGTGFVEYNEALLTNIGAEELSPQLDAAFDLSFTIFGQTFTPADDINQPNFPFALFFDGVLDGFDFIVSEYQLDPGGDPQTLTDITQVGVFGFSVEGLFVEQGLPENEEFPSILAVALPDFDVFVDDFGPQVVPLPATLPLLTGALLLAGVAARRRSRK